MKMSRNIGTNSSSVSIWKAPARRVLSNTNEDEKAQIPALGIDGLRTIGRIVNGIKARFDTTPEPLGTSWPPTAVGSC